jgi:tryptophan-rich sensory protein
MLEILNSPDFSGLIANIAVSVFGTIVLNGLIFGLGWSRLDRPALLDPTVLPKITPPGYAFGIVWTVLFTCMGAARWLVGKGTDLQVVPHQQLIVSLIIFCLLQPLYSTAIGSRVGGLLGTLATVVLAAFTTVSVRSSSELAALLILPVALWTSFASFLLIAVIRSRGWSISRR